MQDILYKTDTKIKWFYAGNVTAIQDMVDYLNSIAFIFIFYKMPEIFELCNNYTIFHNGEFISTGKIADIMAEQVNEMMVCANDSATTS